MGATLRDDFWRLRLVGFIAGSVLAVLAVSGVLASTLFSQPSTIKYLATVAGTAMLVLVCTVRAPLKLLVGIAIVVAPFDFATTLAGIHVTPLLAVAVVALIVWLPRSAVPASSALVSVAALFVLLMLPALVGSDAPADWTEWLAVTVVTGCLAFVIAREPGGPAYIATMLALSALIQAGIALWEQRTHHLLNLYQQSGTVPVGSQYFFTYGSDFRPAAALPDPIGLGQVLALCLPMMVALAAAVRRWHLSVAILAAAGVTSLALLLSLSRMSTVGATIGLAVVLVLLPRRAGFTTGAGVLAMVAIVAVLGVAIGGKPLTRRISSIFHPTAAHVYTARGDITREQIWVAALKTSEANLVTGVGFGNVAKHLPKYGVPVTSASHAHNTYLQFFAEGGVLGLLGLLSLIVAAVIDLGRAFATERIWVAGATGALVATLLSWLTDVEVHYAQVSAMVAVLLGLIAALAASRARGGVRTAPGPAPQSYDPPPIIGPALNGATGVPSRLSRPPARQLIPTASTPAPPTDSAPAPAPPTDSASTPAPPTDSASATAILAAHSAGRATGTRMGRAPAVRGPTLAILFPSREVGGAERYIQGIAEAAVARGWRVHAGFPAHRETAMLRVQLGEAGVKCHPLVPAAPSPQGSAEALRLAATEARSALGLLVRVRPAATFVILPHPDQAPGYVLAAAAYPARAVTSVHVVPPELRFTRARRLLYSSCQALGERWVAVSSDNQRRLAAALNWSRDKIEVVRNGVDAVNVPTSQDRLEIRREVREELELSPDAQLIVSVGRLNVQKGHDLIAESIPAVLADHRDAYWVWVGEGAARETLTARLGRSGVADHVRMLGARDDVPRLLAAADLFVHPSRYEGSPFAVLEALASEVPVIVSDAGPLPEIVRDGVEGRVVPSEDPGALSAATSRALDHGRETRGMAEAGRRRVRAEFSSERMIDQTLALLAPGAEPAVTRGRPKDNARPHVAR